MSSQEIDSEEIFVIRTLECDLCLKFDSIMLAKQELIKRVNSNKLKIGSHYVKHKDHIRIIYFDIDGNFIGDTLSLNMGYKVYQPSNYPIPIFTKNTQSRAITILRSMLRVILTNKMKLCIVGPSLVGKTSLTRFLESGIPECYNNKFSHPVTMGRSVRRINIGNSTLKIFDMGGQRDFWQKWEESINTADKIIYIVDGSANNEDEMMEGLSYVLKIRNKRNIPILFIVNKLDLLYEGYTNEFVRLSDLSFNTLIEGERNVLGLETSIYNGVCYNYDSEADESPLSQVIIDFVNIKN